MSKQPDVTFEALFRNMSRAEKRGSAKDIEIALDVVQFLVGKMTTGDVQFRRIMELAESIHERCGQLQ